MASYGTYQGMFNSSPTPYRPGAKSMPLAYSAGSALGSAAGVKTPKDVLEHLAEVRLHSMDQIESVRGRANAPAHNPATTQEQAGNVLTPFMALMAASQGGKGGVDLSAYNTALQQSRAQEGQNKADIGSWYGQLSGMYGKAGKADKRASRKGVKQAKNFNASLSGAQADKGVAYALGLGGQAEGNYLMEQGQNQAAFDRRMGADAVAQGNYQKMVQARLGAQERSGIRSDMAQAAQAQQGDSFSRMLQVLQLLPEDARQAYLTGQPQGATGPAGADFNNMRDALGESADSMFRDIKDPTTGDTVEQYTGPASTPGSGGFPLVLSQLRDAAASSGMDLNDPRVREAFRAWVAGNFTNRYNMNNAANAPDYRRSGQSFVQY